MGYFSVASIRRGNERRMLNEHCINLNYRILFNKEPMNFLSFYLSVKKYAYRTKHAHTRIKTDTSAHAHTHTHTRTRARARTHARAHAHAHAHAHIHTQNITQYTHSQSCCMEVKAIFPSQNMQHWVHHKTKCGGKRENITLNLSLQMKEETYVYIRAAY
jgi:hypothetical protein